MAIRLSRKVFITEEKQFLPIAKGIMENNFDKFCILCDSILSTCCNKPTYNIDRLNNILGSWFNEYKEVYYR